MSQTRHFKMSISERMARTFSDSFKASKVRELELGRTSISEICHEYETSRTTVYRWLRKYSSRKNDKPEKVIVETKSDTRKLLDLKKRVAELEQIIGQKQILIDFQDELIRLAEAHYQIDIKKNSTSQQS